MSLLFRIKIVVRPREGISDPEGDTLASRLDKKGIQGISKARSGRYWEIFLAADSRDKAEHLARQIHSGPPLVNPVKDDVQLLAVEEVE